MKHNKNFVFIFSAALILFTSLSGCKKGEGDPLLSLQSRKARVAGEWTYSKMIDKTEYTATSEYDGDSYTSSGDFTMEVNGSTLSASGKQSYETPFGPQTSTMNGSGGATYTINIEKDGTFKRIMKIKNLSFTITEAGDIETMTINSTIESTGTWNFLGGMEEEYKNKERIILNIQEDKNSSTLIDSDGDESINIDTDTYSNGIYNEVWHIHTLKNNEMIVEAEKNRTGVSTSIYKYSGDSTTDNYTSTEKGSMSATLQQK